MRVLGIHDGHNASVCLIEDGQIKFAIQEERLVNEKNKSGFPLNSLKRMLSYLKLTVDDIDIVAVASSHNSPEFATGEYFKKHHKSDLRRKTEALVMKTPLYSHYKKKIKDKRIDRLVQLGFSKDKINFIDHHLCHAATAYFGSHFQRNEKILVLTNDGAGDGLCATVSIAENGQLKRIAEVKSTDSLAGIYCLITKMLGFKPLEHEYKLMGMAPYTSEYGKEQGYKIFKDLIKISGSNPLVFERTTSEPISLIMPKLLERSKYVRFDNICAGLQAFTENILVEWVNNCIKHTGIKKVALAGGIFMNVKANKKIMEIEEVEDLFVFPSCGDETVAIGAAYWVYSQQPNTVPIQPLDHFYLGDDFTDKDVLKELASRKSEFTFSYEKPKEIEPVIAKLLFEKKVVACCRGRMEFGARALGNRSILADPSNQDCVREINMMVKKRDFWMPFAPVMIKEKANEYIKNKKNIKSPYMILSFDSTSKFKEFISAVHQADLTARPQIIEEKMNPSYYKILKEFYSLTGRGVILNTSFNLHGLPIVHGPKEAMDVFKNSDLKYLVLGNYLVKKEQL